MSICRLCNRYDTDGVGEMVKYGPRHYAHGSCAIARWGKDILTKIPAHQLGKLPFLALKDAGLLEVVEAKYHAYQRENDERVARVKADWAIRDVKEQGSV